MTRITRGVVAIRYVLPVLCNVVMFSHNGPVLRHVYAYNPTTVPSRPISKVTIEHKSYRASETLPLACCSDDRKCRKWFLVPFDFGSWQPNFDAANSGIRVAT